MMKHAYCTIVTHNYLPFAKVLSGSIKEHEPEADIFVLVTDVEEKTAALEDANYHLIILPDLADDPLIRHMAFYYDAFEFCNALRPYLHDYMLNNTNFDSWLYLDADIFAAGSLEPLWEEFGDSSFLLSPHIGNLNSVHPDADKEFNCLKFGIFNSGVLGLKRSKDCELFIEWFKTRLQRYCKRDTVNRMYVDQIWLDLVPILFSNVHLIAHPGANIAYWNIHEKELSIIDDKIHVNGLPALFFHLSGWKIDSPSRLSTFAYSTTPQNAEILSRLGGQYEKRLLTAKVLDFKKLPYGHACFTNGKQILEWMREIYYKQATKGDLLTPSPFDTPSTFSFSRYIMATLGKFMAESVFRRVLKIFSR